MHLPEGIYKFGVWVVILVKPVIVGKLRYEVDVPATTVVVSLKQYCIPGGQKEVTETIQEYVDAGVLVQITIRWNNPIWPVRKADGSWRMTVDYRVLNKVTPPIAAAVPNVVTLIE